jgi:tetratricopeptide (TPR) repeat protein
LRPFVSLLSCLLATGTIVVGFADYAHVPVDTPLGLRLGRFYLLNDGLAVESARARIDRIGFAGAGKVFDSVLQRDPGSAYRWCDTGEALLNSGRPIQAERCYARAGQLAPHDVRILLDIGDFYSTLGRRELALKNFSPILRQTGAPFGDILTGNIFTYYETMKVRQNHLLDQAIPDGPNASAYVGYLLRNGNPSAAREVWDWACRKGFDDDTTAIAYTRYMFDKGQYEAAEDGWVKHFARRNDGYPQSSLIFNGGFEYESTEGPFDWVFRGADGIKAARDHQTRQAGEYSYRVDFTGNHNFDFHGLSEAVYVRPGRYHFEAWMRTANISSDQGIRFRLRTARDGSPSAIETEALTGTNDWTRLQAEVDVPPGVPLLDVSVARRPSFRIDNQFTGTVWIDSVKLTPRSGTSNKPLN